jgi:hypothetical protein
MDLIDIYRIFNPTDKDTKCTFSPVANGTFSKIGHILEHKANLNKYK